MKKIGFTLAEVLICLGIIGVVASITLPALTSNVQKQQVGPGLAKAINALETANGLALQQYGARNMKEIAIAESGVTSYFDSVLKPYLKVSKLAAQPSNLKYKTFNFSDDYSGGANGGYYYTSQDGIGYIRPSSAGVSSVGADVIKKLPAGYSGEYYTVFVDTNGFNKKPNAIGKDLFKLLVDTKGTVFPVGGVAHKKYTTGEDSVTPDWESSCKEDVSNAENCAGSVIDNGAKVIYKY